MAELKPCPKGHKAEIRCDDAYSEVPTQYIAQCSVCEWSNGTWDTKDAAIEAWNTRCPSPATDALVEALRSSLDYILHKHNLCKAARAEKRLEVMGIINEALAAVDALKGG